MSRPFNKAKALDIYRVMIEYQQKEDFSLTTREIAELMGYKSYSWVTPYIKWLTANGYVKHKGKQFRAIPQEDKDG